MRAALVVWVAVLLTCTSGPAPLEAPSRARGQGAETSEGAGPPASAPWATKTPADVGLKPAPLADREAKRSILLRHVLTMTAGLEWDESMPYTDPRNACVTYPTESAVARIAVRRWWRRSPMPGEPATP